jgi:hypothetical protein
MIQKFNSCSLGTFWQVRCDGCTEYDKEKPVGPPAFSSNDPVKVQEFLKTEGFWPDKMLDEWICSDCLRYFFLHLTKNP